MLLVAAGLNAFPRHTQEPAAEQEAEASGVAESELALYIEVYSAMQADHDLTIDAALAPRQVTLERFRNIEQRVQKDQRLVDRVRQALLEHAKSRSFAALGAPENPSPPSPGGKTEDRDPK